MFSNTVLGVCLVVAVIALGYWKDLVAQNHLYRLKREPAYLVGIIGSPEGTAERKAIRCFLTSSQGKKALLSLLLSLVRPPAGVPGRYAPSPIKLEVVVKGIVGVREGKGVWVQPAKTNRYRGRRLVVSNNSSTFLRLRSEERQLSKVRQGDNMHDRRLHELRPQATTTAHVPLGSNGVLLARKPRVVPNVFRS